MGNPNINGESVWILLLEILRMEKFYLVKLSVKTDGLNQQICRLVEVMHMKEVANIFRLG